MTGKIVVVLALAVAIYFLPSNDIDTNSVLENDRTREITKQIQQWSNELGIDSPKLVFTGVPGMSSGYGSDGEYYENSETVASYRGDSDTIIFRTSFDEHTVKHEFIHYLQDVLGVCRKDLQCREAQAYEMDDMPIETIMDWYKTYE